MSADAAPQPPPMHPRDLELNAAGDELFAFVRDWAPRHKLSSVEYLDTVAALLRHQTLTMRLHERAGAPGAKP